MQELGASPWDSQHREFDYDLDDIEGAIPGGLRGALYRIGPGRLDVDGHPLSHIFDGDGMVSRIDIGPEGVHYRNRYVRTKSFARTNETRRPAKGFSTQRIGGSLANALRFPENLANTSVLLHDDVLYALWEGGRPHRLDAETLQTYGPESFGGALKRLGASSAHPKTHPATGEVFNSGLDFFLRPMIRCYRLDRGRRLHGLATVPIPKLGFVHDFALTERHLMFVLGPLVVRNPIPVALGLRPFDDALSYRPELGTTIVLVPRDGGRPTHRRTRCAVPFPRHQCPRRRGPHRRRTRRTRSRRWLGRVEQAPTQLSRVPRAGLRGHPHPAVGRSADPPRHHHRTRLSRM